MQRLGDPAEDVRGPNSRRPTPEIGRRQIGLRLEFRHTSGHLSRKRPGYYLILLRHELRHRSLAKRPGALADE